MSHGSSQPPEPYERTYSFSNWSVTHPGEPHQGDKIDTQLDQVAASIQETIGRLNEIQADDGHIRPSALDSGIDDIVAAAAEQAAEQTYADSLASVPDKALARANLQLDANYIRVDGDNVWIYDVQNQQPVFPVATTGHPSQGSQSGSWPGVLASSTFLSREARSATLFGTQYDYATWNAGTFAPPVSLRVDNVSFALLYGGTLKQTGALASGVLTADYGLLQNLPSAKNPFATVRMLVDAKTTHEQTHNHGNLPSTAQKAALDAAATPSASNPFATLGDLAAGGALTPDQVDAVAGSSLPSATNVLVTTSALTAGLATKADGTHTHIIGDIEDGLGTPLQTIIDSKAATPVHVVIGGSDYLDFVADDGLTYRVAATLV